jgi:DnaJ domain
MTEAYPLHWPFGKPRAASPQHSRFNVGFSTARDCLMQEINLLGGRLPVLSSNIPIKRDGLPYAGQREPDDRGIAVYFTLRDRQFCFSCDRWDKTADNIQAIRHTIAALRGIERWGTGDMVQQAFTGFLALPSPENPYDVIGVESGATEEEIESAYRKKAKLLHPDLGGDPDAFKRLVDARNKLKGKAA